MKKLYTVLILFLLSGFAFSANTEMFFHKNWVRRTFLKPAFSEKFHHMTPVFYKNLVIQGNGIDGIVAYDKVSGSQVWRKNIKGGVGGGAAVSQGWLYFAGDDGFFYCVSALTGESRWSFPTRAEGLSAPIVVGGMVYFQSSARIVYALNQQTGKKKWIYARKDTSSFSIRGSSSPAIWKNHLFIGFSDGHLLSLNKNTGNVVWETYLNRQNKFRDVDAKAVIDNGFIYIGGFDDHFYKLKGSSGKILWKIPHGVYSEATVEDKTVYISSNKGTVLSINKDTGRIIWETNLKGSLPTSPTIMGENLLVGTSKSDLFLLDKTKGGIKSRFSPGWGLVSKPIVSKGDIYFISNGGNLFSLKVSKKKYFSF